MYNCQVAISTNLDNSDLIKVPNLLEELFKKKLDDVILYLQSIRVNNVFSQYSKLTKSLKPKMVWFKVNLYENLYILIGENLINKCLTNNIERN